MGFKFEKMNNPPAPQKPSTPGLPEREKLNKNISNPKI